MPASEPSVEPAATCFLLTDVRPIEASARPAVIESFVGRDLTVSMTDPPLPGSHLEVNLGDQGWVDGVVRWTGGCRVCVELERDVDWASLVDTGAPAGTPTDNAMLTRRTPRRDRPRR